MPPLETPRLGKGERRAGGRSATDEHGQARGRLSSCQPSTTAAVPSRLPPGGSDRYAIVTHGETEEERRRGEGEEEGEGGAGSLAPLAARRPRQLIRTMK